MKNADTGRIQILGLYRIVILRPDPDYTVVKKAGSGYRAGYTVVAGFRISVFFFKTALIFILGRNNTRQQHPIQHQHISSEY